VPTAPKADHWWNNTAFWGSSSFFVSIVLIVVAATLKDLRWLLWVALSFGCITIWVLAGNVSSKKWKFSLVTCGIILISAAMLWLYLILRPLTGALTREQQLAFTKVLKTALVAPDYTIIACPEADETTCVYANSYIPLFQRAGWKIKGPSVQRVLVGRPQSGVWVSHLGPPLADPQDPDHGVWSKIPPFLQPIKTAFGIVDIPVGSENDPLLPFNEVRVYFGSIPTR
jgi:hypothetical protein